MSHSAAYSKAEIQTIIDERIRDIRTWLDAYGFSAAEFAEEMKPFYHPLRTEDFLSRPLASLQAREFLRRAEPTLARMIARRVNGNNPEADITHNDLNFTASGHGLPELQKAVRDAKADHGITIADLAEELRPLYRADTVYKYLRPAYRGARPQPRFVCLAEQALARLIQKRRGGAAA